MQDLLSLPPWFKQYRPWQLTAIAQTVHAFNSGYDFVFLDAPTGAGKTLIAESVRQLLKLNAAYICVTKTLQDQFVHDYEYSRVLKGRSNYPVEVDEFNQGLTAEDHSGDGCKLCPNMCLYAAAKDDAIASPLAVLNLAYATTEFNIRKSVFNNRGLKIIDECDLIEDVLMSQASISISPRQQEYLGITTPGKKTVPVEWWKWSVKTQEILLKKLDSFPSRVYGEDPSSIKLRRAKKRVRTLYDKIVKLTLDLQQGLVDQEQKWIYSGYDRNYIEFKPVTVEEFGKELLWRHGGKWLLMSGSIISDSVFARDIGIERFKTVTVDYSFDAKQRPVYVDVVGSMKRAAIDTTTPKLIDRLKTLIAVHHDERVLIHCHSYHLAKKLHEGFGKPLGPKYEGLVDHFPDRVFTYTSSSEKDEALFWYKEKSDGVIIAPSLDRGVDLPYDLCKVQVICKVPFPYLGDKQVSARTYGTRGGQMWYTVQTIRSLVQMTGRGMRHADDEVVTYILDSDFERLYREKGNLFPNWWREAVVKT